jgi:RHS repeat-associated protein
MYDFLFRQHASSQGRWLVPDPAGLAAVDPTNPQTWNRYAYVGNNPVGEVDPSGLCGEITAGIGMSPESDSGQALIALAQGLQFNVAFPYAGQSRTTSIYDIYRHSSGLNQAATNVSQAAISATQADAAANGTGFLSIGFSGGAQSNLDAFQQLGMTANGSNTILLDPGLGAGTSPPAGVSVYRGAQDWSPLVNGTSAGGNSISVSGCGHDAVCLINNGGASLSQSIAAAGPCSNPTLFVQGKSPTPLRPVQTGGGGAGGGTGGGWTYSYGGFFLNGTVETGYSGFFIGFGAPAPGGPRWIK